MDTKLEFWKAKLKECLVRAKLNTGQIEAILNQYDKTVTRTTSGESAFSTLVQYYGNEDTAAALKQAKASYLAQFVEDRLQKFSSEHKIDTKNKDAIRIFHAKYGDGGNYEEKLNQARKLKYNLPRGLELSDSRDIAGSVQRVVDHNEKTKRLNNQLAQASFKSELVALELEVRR